MTDEHKELTGCALSVIIFAIAAAFAYVGAGDYADEVAKEQEQVAERRQLVCETAEECEARLAAGLPVWKGELR